MTVRIIQCPLGVWNFPPSLAHVTCLEFVTFLIRYSWTRGFSRPRDSYLLDFCFNLSSLTFIYSLLGR
ncbi:hypothetical protein EDD85DRAFT_865192 [Armillaria nabsnona]|nr:hypothetical protein EDD85DRAFT_865192 [Armillaria nabsnona]